MSVAILSVCGLVRMMGDHNISVSFLQHVKALEHCPDQVSQALIDTYDIGTKVTREGTVYECNAKYPSCMWKIIGSCVIMHESLSYIVWLALFPRANCPQGIFER